MNTAATCCPPRLEASSVVERVGNTPLLDLSRLVGRGEVRLFAKAEMTNPGGSVKDRPGLAMIRDAEARRLAKEQPERFAYLDQYSNPGNWRAHHRTPGPEIWEQTGGSLTHFVTGLGTSGTFGGVSRLLEECAPEVVRVSVEPDGPFHGLEGMKHMASAIVPPIYDPELTPTSGGFSPPRRPM